MRFPVRAMWFPDKSSFLDTGFRMTATKKIIQNLDSRGHYCR